jgi:hypothetical protein
MTSNTITIPVRETARSLNKSEMEQQFALAWTTSLPRLDPSGAQDRLFAPTSFVSITYPVRRVGAAYHQPVQAAKNHSAKTNQDSPNGGNRAASSRSFFHHLACFKGRPSNGYEQSLELGFRLLAEPAGTAYFDESATQLKVFNGFNL